MFLVTPSHNIKRRCRIASVERIRRARSELQTCREVEEQGMRRDDEFSAVVEVARRDDLMLYSWPTCTSDTATRSDTMYGSC